MADASDFFEASAFLATPCFAACCLAANEMGVANNDANVMAHAMEIWEEVKVFMALLKTVRLLSLKWFQNHGDKHNKKAPCGACCKPREGLGFVLAETEGFEPSMRLYTPYSLSRGAPSATRSRFQHSKIISGLVKVESLVQGADGQFHVFFIDHHGSFNF